jgi:hypothetical protein
MRLELRSILLQYARFVEFHTGKEGGSQCVYQEVSAVDQKGKELQDRVSHLMIVIVEHVTDKNEGDGKEAVVNAVKRIEVDIKELLRCGLQGVVQDGC